MSSHVVPPAPSGGALADVGRAPAPPSQGQAGGGRAGRADRGGVWSTAWRLGLAGLIGSLSILLVAVDGAQGVTSATPADWWLDLVVGLGGLVLVAWRHRRPLLVVSVLGLAGAVSQFAGGPWLLAAVSVATRRRWPDLLVVAATSLLGMIGYEHLHPAQDPGPLWFTPVFGAVVVGAVTAYGWYVGARRDLLDSLRERAETAEREKVALLATARTNERAAIAREMHDVLAHRISLVAMHAGALTFRPDLDETRRAEIVRTIEENAQLALADLRDVLGVLRDPTTTWDAPPARPQPTLRDVPGLVAEAVAAGSAVTFEGDVAADPPTTLGRHAYRIAQETLTNVRKHAPGRPATLRIFGAPGGDLVVETVNPMPLRPPAGTALTGAGAGLAGMAERTALAGGTLEHGPTRDGRFVVTARLPWPEGTDTTGAAAPEGANPPGLPPPSRDGAEPAPPSDPAHRAATAAGDEHP